MVQLLHVEWGRMNGTQGWRTAWRSDCNGDLPRDGLHRGGVQRRDRRATFGVACIIILMALVVEAGWEEVQGRVGRMLLAWRGRRSV